MKAKSIIYIGIVLLLLNSCKVGKHYTRPNLNLPEPADSWGTDSTTLANYEWKELYQDTTLRKLIEQALSYNKDMLMAAAHVKEMAAMKRISYSGLFPSVNVNVYGKQEGENHTGHSFHHKDEYGIKTSASWEIDLWGNLRWAKDKAVAEFMQSIENQRAVRMSLIAQVAQNYFELVALDHELSIVKQTVEARRESLHLARIRYEGGLTAETAFRQAQVELARTATLLPDLERKITIKENEIAFLTGEYPHHIERMPIVGSGIFSDTLPVGLPSTLLERRPDVRSAEQALIAANAQVGMAFTNLFPKISLTASYGTESEDLSDILSAPNHFLSVNLLQPIFAAGKNRALLKGKKAAMEKATYAYEKAVLQAFKDAHNAIAEFNKMKEIYDRRQRLEQASKSTLELAKLQYINGVIGYMDLLDAQRGYLDAQIGLSKAVRDQQITTVNLYKALGGGW